MAYQFDPELQPVVSALPSTDLNDPVAARKRMREMMAVANRDVDCRGLSIEDRQIGGYGSADSIGVRLYSPADCAGDTAAGQLGCILHIHGGGFVMGDLDTEHATSVALARNLGVVVVSVDYRLAPEHPYPAALEDCYGTLLWLHQQANSLGVDPKRVAVYGQSAGGGLGAALALKVREEGLTCSRGGPAIRFLFLGMPEVDDRLNTGSMEQFTDTPIWSRPKAELSWQYYLGDQYTRGGDVPPLAAPAREKDLSGLPPTYISAMEFDPLRDEDILFALKMMQAGVPVELHTYPGTFHGSAIAVKAAVSKRQAKEMFSVLSRALEIAS